MHSVRGTFAMGTLACVAAVASASVGQASTEHVTTAPFSGWDQTGARLKLQYQEWLRKDTPRSSAPERAQAFYVQSTEPHATAKRLRELGASVGTIAGDVLTVRADIRLLPNIAALPSVARMEAGTPTRPQLNLAVPTMRADLVHAGTGLKQPYLGKGVLVGVVDEWLDYKHAAFLGEDGQTRVVGIWDTTLEGTPPSGFTYGHVCDEPSLKAGECKHEAFGTHGTHVTGTAAGAKVSPSTYQGLAPEAEVLFVHRGGGEGDRGGGESAGACDGVAWIMEQAKARKKPVVINLSFGGVSGPRTGLTLENKCLDNLVEAYGPGCVLVAAAGNSGGGSTRSVGDGEVRLSVHATGTANGTPQSVEFYRSADSSHVELYYYEPATLTLRIGVKAGTNGEVGWSKEISATRTGQQFLAIDDNPYAASVTVERAPSANGTAGFVIDTDGGEADSVWLLEVTGGDGDGGGDGGGGGGRDDAGGDTDRAQVWDAFINTVGAAGFLEPSGQSPVTVDNHMTISYPADSRYVLSVASYVSRTSWLDLEEQTVSAGPGAVMGALSTFSSKGPSRNMAFTRNIPELAGPGQAVIAAMSAVGFDITNPKIVLPPPNGFAAISGTSIAAPAVTGAVALMLQVNDQLDVNDVRRVIEATAVPLSETAPLPNTLWGFGKFDAEAAMIEVGAQADAGTGGSSGETPPAAGPSPGTAEGTGVITTSDGCTAASRGPGHASTGGLALLALAAALGATRLRRSRTAALGANRLRRSRTAARKRTR